MNNQFYLRRRRSHWRNKQGLAIIDICLTLFFLMSILQYLIPLSFKILANSVAMEVNYHLNSIVNGFQSEHLTPLEFEKHLGNEIKKN